VDESLIRYLDELYQRGREYDEQKSDRRDRLRNIEPETAQLLAVLIRALAPAHMLEIGTSNGYSTVWLADAARDVGAAFVSVEVDADRSNQAAANLAAVGLDQLVELRVEDAASTLANAPDAAYGLMLLDAERDAYTAYWREIVRTLTPRGLLAVDNATSHAAELQAFNDLITSDGRFISALCPTGAGLLVVTRISSIG
jgi:predicted O-methyltransferase YrrM